MTFLADLRQFKQGAAAAQPCADRKRAQIDPADDQVFSERAGLYTCALRIEGIDLFGGKQADLPVPTARVCIALYAPVCDELCTGARLFLCAACFADTHGDDGSHGYPPI